MEGYGGFMEAFLIAIFGEKVYVYGMFVFFGIVFGAVPLVFGIKRKAIPHGILSVIGFSYLSPVVAIAAMFWIDQYSSKKEKEKRAANRKKYSAVMKEKAEREAKEGRIYKENPDAEFTAWPPISKIVDEEALEEYNKMTEQEEKQVEKWTSNPDDSEQADN